MNILSKWNIAALALVAYAGISLQTTSAAELKKGPVKVFILAGDSNCEGKAATAMPA